MTTKKAAKKSAPAKKTTKQAAPKKVGPVAVMRGIATVAVAMKVEHPRRVALHVMKEQGFNVHTAARQFQEVHAGKVSVELTAVERTEIEGLITAAVKAMEKAAE